jgi:hypothetical protein
MQTTEPPPLPASADTPAAAVPGTPAPANSPVNELKQVLTWIFRIALSLICLAFTFHRSGCLAGNNDPGAGPTNQAVARNDGLSRQDLSLASCTLMGAWRSEHDVLPASIESWAGSAAVFRRAGGKIVLVTNKHCLALAELAQSAYAGAPMVGAYQLRIRFPSGAERDVTRFACPGGAIDLAMLEVDGQGLRERHDYVVLPFVAQTELHEGDEVVAVGTPLGILEGTQSFGRISAFRPQQDAGRS